MNGYYDRSDSIVKGEDKMSNELYEWLPSIKQDKRIFVVNDLKRFRMSEVNDR